MFDDLLDTPWIIQKLVLASSVTLQCGSITFDLGKLRKDMIHRLFKLYNKCLLRLKAPDAQSIWSSLELVTKFTEL